VLADDHYLVLHEVRLRGRVALDDRVELQVLLEAGLVACRRDLVHTTPEGRAHHERWARLAPGSDAEQAAADAYERFGPLNQEFLRICHDWQVRPGNVPNDHRDLRYDWGVIDRLRVLDERSAPLVRRLGRTVARFEPYPRRLRAALARVDDGELEWFTSPKLDSYHTVWMQLHEDLLLALGIERTDEPQQRGTTPATRDRPSSSRGRRGPGRARRES
jgi:hypothetical protein